MGQIRWILMVLALGCFINTDFAQEIPHMFLQSTDYGMLVQGQVRPGAGFHLEASTNTKQWSHLYEGIAASSLISYQDSYSSQFNERFYRLSQYPVPSNDHFSHATELKGNNIQLKAANYNATFESQEPQHAALYEGGHSVWFRWKAEEDAHVVIDTIDSYFDTLLAIYTRTNLRHLREESKPIYHSHLVAFDAIKGNEYFIAVDGFGGQMGVFNLRLVATPVPKTVPETLVGTFCDLVDSEHPWESFLKLTISNDGASWNLKRNNKNFLQGRIKKGELHENTWELIFMTDEKEDSGEDLRCELKFTSPATGDFILSSADFKGSGKFSNFHYIENAFAPPTLAEQTLTTIRTFTSTGPVGQAHYYTFTDDRFHDANNEEHAIGKYTYKADGDEAELVTYYDGPADFIGDRHHLKLRFSDPFSGTFTSTYIRNDGVKIIMDGTFEIN